VPPFRKPAKKTVTHRFEKKPCPSCFLCFKISTRSLPYVRWGYSIHNTNPARKMQGSCLRLPPQEYWRLLKPPAINFDKERYAKFNYLLTLRIATRCRFTLLAFQP
jgi:hypothetical protein